MNRVTIVIFCSIALIWMNNAYSQEGSSHGGPPIPEGSSHPHEGSNDRRIPYKGFKKVGEAVAYINSTEGNRTSGSVRFSRSGHAVKVVADINGLKPNSKHAIHIHEFGDCSSSDGKSAGGHYNPLGVDHASPDDKERHAGDLGNLTADGNGNAHYELVVDNITLGSRKNPIIGRAVIIHAGEDDLKSQPTGNAGARIGCGIIGIAKTGE